MKEETKPEMTAEEFVEAIVAMQAQSCFMGTFEMDELREEVRACLRSVILGKLYEFAQEFNESSSPYILDGMIEKFLSNNQ
jgi:hypothetical protein